MREWLVGLVGSELADKALYLVVAAIVLVLLFLVVWVARKALGGSIGARAKGRGPRLAVMDVAAIDPKRKLVLIRRDEVEHLLLVGGQNDVVVEAGILRIPASARGARVEPGLRSEAEAAGVVRQPAASAAAAQVARGPVRARPVPAEAERRAPAPAGSAANRGTSVLTRPVPRAPSESVDRPGAAGSPAEAPRTASARAPSQELSAAEEKRPPAPPEHIPDVTPPEIALENRKPSVAEPVEPSVVRQLDKEANVFEEELRVAPAVEPPSPEERLEVERRSDVPPPLSRPEEDEGVRPEAPPEAPPAPVVTPQPAPVPRRAGISLPSPAERIPARPIPRVTVGGGTEPVRRVSTAPAGASAAAPAVSRSMATPTYPVKATFPGPEGTPTAVDRVAVAAVTEPIQTAFSVPASPPPQSPFSGLSAIEPVGVEPAPISAPMSPIIAAAERQQELIRSRGTPVLPRTASPILDSGGNALAASGAPSGPVAAQGEEEPAEKRPLAVRSFATSIQTRRPSFDAPAPAPLPAAAEVPQRQDPEVLVPAPLQTPVAAPEAENTASAVGAETAPSLEEFLSAELDSDFADTDWSAGADAAGAPRADEPRGDIRFAPDAPTGDEPPRSLTLEEEMERLLGDFNFDTSSRSKKN